MPGVPVEVLMLRVVLGIGVLGILVMVAVADRPQAAATPTVTSVASPDGASPAGVVPKSCVFKGKRLWGKVQVVNAFPDFKVQRVTAFPDLKVQEVNAFPDSCGKWQLVTAFPDFKIQYVTAFPDFKIQKVNAFPGVP
jgi:hypothetical protein